jgi:hypothetical protein
MDKFELDNSLTDDLRKRIEELIDEYGLENIFDLIIDKVPNLLLEDILSELESEI